MDMTDLVELGLADSERERIEIVDLEPVMIATDGVEGLSAIVSQLVYNATQLLSQEDDRVRISGSVEPSGYSLLIIDRGAVMSDAFLEGLNLILANPRASGDGLRTSGIQVVAELAARHGIGVRLERGSPGVTARVAIPAWLLDGPAGEDVVTEESVVDLTPPEQVLGGSPVTDTEAAFLESVFGPLLTGSPMRSPAPRAAAIEPIPAAIEVLPERPEQRAEYRRATLLTRIPGRNYTEPNNDPARTKPGEAAVEIKLALKDFTRGRLAARNSEGP